MKQSGAVEACWAHNPEVRRSKLRSAIHLTRYSCTDMGGILLERSVFVGITDPNSAYLGFVPLSIPGNVEGRPALLVLLVRLRPLVEQDGGDVGVAVERRQVERSPAPVVRVDVDAVLQQRAYRVGLTVPAYELQHCNSN